MSNPPLANAVVSAVGSLIPSFVTKWYLRKLTDRLAKMGKQASRGAENGLTNNLAKRKSWPIAFVACFDVFLVRLPPRVGLQYQDILVENDLLQKAVSRLPPEAQLERNRRIQRALDLSAKHEEIPEGKQCNPWQDYAEFKALLEETQQLADEKSHLSNKAW